MTGLTDTEIREALRQNIVQFASFLADDYVSMRTPTMRFDFVPIELEIIKALFNNFMVLFMRHNDSVDHEDIHICGAVRVVYYHHDTIMADSRIKFISIRRDILWVIGTALMRLAQFENVNTQTKDLIDQTLEFFVNPDKDVWSRYVCFDKTNKYPALKIGQACQGSTQ